MRGRLRSVEKKSLKKKRESSSSVGRKLAARKSPSRVNSRTNSPKTPKTTPKKKPHESRSSKSPGRKSPSRQSPVRKSPSRLTPVSSRVENEDKKVTQIKTSTPVIDIDTDSDDPYVTRLRKPQITLRSRARRLTSDYKTKDVDDEERHRIFFSGVSSRTINLPSSHEAESIVHVKETISTIEQKLLEFSDDDDLSQPRKPIDSIESTPSQKAFVAEFGGWFGALFFIAFLPFEVIFLNVICNEKKCSFSLPLILEPFKKLSTYLNLSAGLGFLTFVILLALFSALPFGGKKVQGLFNKNGKLNYVMNGLLSTVIIHLILFTLELYKIPIIDLIYDKYFQLAVSSVILGITLSIYLYARSFFVPVSALNPNGDTNSVIYNFFMGREINPRICEVVDVKMLLFRIVNISVVVFNSVLLYKSLALNSVVFGENFDLNLLYFHPTLLTLLFLFYIYFLDGLAFEHAWITTYEIQHEGAGYMASLGFTSAAFTYAIIPKYVMDFKVNLSTWQLIASVLQFFVGYFLYRGSNSQKYLFRKNPYSPAVAHLKTIPTCHGKKLIVSGFWGFVRHPNYLGDILMHLAFLYYVVSVPPAITCIASVLILIHRAKRDGFHCKQKYEVAWDRYCQHVKYVLIPKVY